ncbi:NlpC/P60 family protein [Streptomyces sp. NBC_00124]|uniref:C40 family peptidase n=1 Tax=Streptomyces sp. NBC_00124 TaxID=2975662 RepID=UPI00225555EF|nr:NlpC/P60 family protein [Streptomyces sp. NBC_00124]MCX5366510.1 NlpC/P60 family protein [Streptomyces sp. NBC_00124]
MAPERTSPPEVTPFSGRDNSLAPREGEGPSRDEVRRKIDSLYDRAESDTGTFNATRAAAIPRQRGAGGRDRSQEDMQPAVGALARQWFDAARAKLGPTVPVRMPARPDRAPQQERPARPTERPAQPLALEAPKAPKDVVRELTGGSAQAPTTGFLPELPAPPVEPTAASESRLDESAWHTGEQPVLGGDGAAWPLYQPASATAPEPTAAWPIAPEPTATWPIAPDPTVGTYQAELPAIGAETYGAGPATDATDAYATALPADPTAAYTAGPPADVTTATYGAGLPTAPVFALAAPAPAAPIETAAAPAYAYAAPPVSAAPTAPVTYTAPEAPSTPLASAAYGGSWLSADPGHSTQAERVIAFARAQIGRPCVWGAVGPGSYDAPGLTQAAWKAAGVTLPRTVQAQSGMGVQISLADVRVGDLVFFHDDLSHVGVWSGDGMMVHAPGPGATIREESVFFAGQSAIKGAVRPA